MGRVVRPAWLAIFAALPLAAVVAGSLGDPPAMMRATEQPASEVPDVLFMAPGNGGDHRCHCYHPHGAAGVNASATIGRDNASFSVRITLQRVAEANATLTVDRPYSGGFRFEPIRSSASALQNSLVLWDEAWPASDRVLAEPVARIAFALPLRPADWVEPPECLENPNA